MKLIIDIDKEDYEKVRRTDDKFLSPIETCVANGTPVNTDGDTISRSALKERVNRTIDYAIDEFDKGYNIGIQKAVELIDNAPTVETYTEEDMKRTIKDNFDLGYEIAKNKYERPKGEWIETQRGIHVTDYMCSCCGRIVRDDTGYDVASDYPFCNCGADMRGYNDTKET